MLPIQIEVESANQLLSEDDSVLLVDCREPHEYELVHLPNSLLVPTSDFLQQVGQLEPHKDRRILVICHHGVRSHGVAQWLREHGYDRTQSITGGIDAWSVKLNPELPRY
jgi:rhodanese-related sulfurtransferase